MNAPTISTRQFTKEFSTLRKRAAQVTDRGQVVGYWTPAPKTPKPVDFLARAMKDTQGRLEFTGAQLLKAGKKR